MNRVTERRHLLVGLLVLVLSMFTLAGTASAHSAHKSKKVAPAKEKETNPVEVGPEEAACTIAPEPANPVDIGENRNHSSIAVILEVECKAEFAEKDVRIASNELWSKCDKDLAWTIDIAEPVTIFGAEKEVQVELDDAGNAEVVVFGTSCAAEGEALVTVDLEAGTHPTSTTAIVIEAPKVTKEGVELYPQHNHAGEESVGGAIENATYSTVLGLAVIEFSPTLAEETVSVSDRQLYEKCKGYPRIRWLGPFGNFINQEALEVETGAVTLDDDGNAFVVFASGRSCKSGNTLFEVSLEEPPFTTLTGNFKVFPPQGTF